jgi:predicted outer membrane lipoprotein
LKRQAFLKNWGLKPIREPESICLGEVVRSPRLPIMFSLSDLGTQIQTRRLLEGHAWTCSRLPARIAPEALSLISGVDCSRTSPISHASHLKGCRQRNLLRAFECGFCAKCASSSVTCHAFLRVPRSDQNHCPPSSGIFGVLAPVAFACAGAMVTALWLENRHSTAWTSFRSCSLLHSTRLVLPCQV